MSLNPTSYGDNPWGPGASAETYNPDQLIAGNLKIVTDTIVLGGAAALLRGTVLGRTTTGAATSAAKTGGNTGGGTLTLDGTAPILQNAQSGVYQVRCTATASNSGTFQVTDPTGDLLGTVVVGATFADQIKFVLADVGTDFAVGDGFDVSVNLTAGVYKKAVKTATDGSEFPSVVLADDVDASGGNVNAPAYLMAELNGSKLIFDATFTLADIKEALRPRGIFVKSAVSAADPS